MSKRMIVCSECGEEKPHAGKGLCDACYKRQRYQNNPEVRKRAQAYQRQYHRTHPERRRVGYHLQRRYGITQAEYDTMLKAQGGVCAICGKPPRKGRRLCVDHAHDNGRVRGLLCDRCNRAIGALSDDQSLLQRVLKYLSR